MYDNNVSITRAASIALWGLALTLHVASWVVFAKAEHWGIMLGFVALSFTGIAGLATIRCYMLATTRQTRVLEEYVVKDLRRIH